MDAGIHGDGRLVFDAWRVWGFATELGRRSIPGRAEAAAALTEALESGLVVETRPGWYSEARPKRSHQREA